MLFFRVKRDSTLYSDLIAAKDMSNKWMDHREELYNAVDMPVLDEIVMYVSQLYYPVEPPQEVRTEFKKHKEAGQFYVTKANSVLSKKWSQLCNELDLKFVLPMNSIIRDAMFSTPYAIGSGLKSVVKIEEDYFLEGERELPRAEFLEQISEVDYLQAKLDAIKKAG